MDKEIILRNKSYYYFDTYSSWKKAYKMAQRYKKEKKHKTKKIEYYILITRAYITGRKVYRLYMTNVINLTPLM